MQLRRAFTLFLVLAVLAALRIDVGNDYGNYADTFHGSMWEAMW